MPIKPHPHCRLCPNPRTTKPTSLALCDDHYLEYERVKAERYRRQRGVRPASERRPMRNISESKKEYQRRKVEKLRRLAAAGQRQCQTEGCGGAIGTPYGKRCDDCRYVAQSVGEELAQRAAGGNRSVPKPVVVKVEVEKVVVRRRPVVQPDILIGPSAFRKPEPVGVVRGKYRRYA